MKHGDVTPGDELPPLRHEVTATTVVLGAIASRDWRPMHHDRDFAVERQGVHDIFLDSPTQTAWVERFVTDWTGPTGRIGRITTRMAHPVFPGDTMQITGTVSGAAIDDASCGWIDLDVILAVGETVCTTATVRVALPTEPGDNPWSRRGNDWRP